MLPTRRLPACIIPTRDYKHPQRYLLLTICRIIDRLRGCWDIQIRRSVSDTAGFTVLTIVPLLFISQEFQAVSNDLENCTCPLAGFYNIASKAFDMNFCDLSSWRCML